MLVNIYQNSPILRAGISASFTRRIRGKSFLSFLIVMLAAKLLAGCENARETEGGKLPYTRHFIDQQVDGHVSAQFAADIDGDMYLDLVIRTGKSGPGEIAWYRNPGKSAEQIESEWQKYTIAKVSYPRGNRSSGSGLSVHDVDGDGRLDIITGANVEGVGNGLFWWRSPRDPATGPWKRYIIAGPDSDSGEELAPHDIVITDINGDEVPDMLVGGASNQGTWWAEFPDRATEFGVWKMRRIGMPRGTSYAGLAAGDLDNDGRIDIVRSDIWYRSSGPRAAPVWEPIAYGLINTPPSNIQLYDIFNDGQLDIVVASGHSEAHGQIYWYSSSGVSTHRWIPHRVATSLAAPESLIISQNLSAVPTIVTAELDFANFKLFPSIISYDLSPNTRNSWRQTVLFRGHKIRQLGEADINKDGQPDLYGVTFANKHGHGQVMWFERK